MAREDPPRDAARLTLERDALSERDDGVYVDCPECGSSTRLLDVAIDGRCSGYGGDTECGAKLWLELVWDS